MGCKVDKIHTKNLNLNVWKQKKAQSLFLTMSSQCLKITEKVSFNIASEASYVYILSGQNGAFLASLWKSEACGQTVLPDRSVLIGQKLVENAKIQKLQMRLFE